MELVYLIVGCLVIGAVLKNLPAILAAVKPIPAPVTIHQAAAPLAMPQAVQTSPIGDTATYGPSSSDAYVAYVNALELEAKIAAAQAIAKEHADKMADHYRGIMSAPPAVPKG